MQRMSTKTHGYIDLMTAGALLAVPRVLKWDAGLTRTLSRAALGMLGYSLLTRYEFGLVKLLPIRGHLALDALSGAAMCGLPVLYPDVDPKVKAGLVATGLFEVAAALMTETKPSDEETGRELLNRAVEIGGALGRSAVHSSEGHSRAGEMLHSLAERLG